MLEGTIPVVGEDYDLSDPAGTGKTVVTASLGVAMMFGIFAVGRELFNRASQTTDQLNEVEVL